MIDQTMVAAPHRLEFADDMFMRRHRGLLAPVTTQVGWVLPSLPSADAVCAVVDHLTRSALSHQAVRSRVPFARDRWEHLERPPTTAAQILEAAHARPALEHDERVAWIRERGMTPLDPHRGRPYDLALVRTADGGAMASLVGSHAVADGARVIMSLSRPPGEAPAAAAGSVRADLADAAAQMREIGRWMAHRKDRAQRRAAAGPAPTPVPRTDADPPPGWRPALAILECPSASMREAVAALGGSRNAFFTALLARLAHRTGRVPSEVEVPVAAPVSTHTRTDERANATRIAQLRLSAEVLAGPDLPAITTLSDAAYERLADTPRELEPIPLAAVQALPDRLFGKLPQPPSASVLATNMGRFPKPMATLFGVAPSAMLGLAFHAGDATAELIASGGGLLGWLADQGDTTVMTVVAADPAHPIDDTDLAELVRAQASEWSLPVQPW